MKEVGQSMAVVPPGVGRSRERDGKSVLQATVGGLDYSNTYQSQGRTQCTK
jgi:hypothetical protein